MLPKHTVIAALSVLGVAAVPPLAPAQTCPEQVLLQRARLLDTEGRHDLFADNWRQVLLMNPAQSDALAVLARFYRSTGDTAKARQYEGTLERLHTGSSTGFSISAAAAMTRSGDAAANLREASRLASAHSYTEALAAYQRAFGSEQPPDNWGIAYYETEAAVPARQPHAVARLRALASKYPANPSFELALARVLTYRPSTRLEGVRMLQSLQGSPEQNDQASAPWKQAILWNLTAPAATETGKLYLQRYPDADLAARLNAAPRPASPAEATSPLESEGYRALAGGDLHTAGDRFSTLAAQAGHTGEGNAGLGYVAMKRKDFVEAVHHFEAAALPASAIPPRTRPSTKPVIGRQRPRATMPWRRGMPMESLQLRPCSRHQWLASRSERSARRFLLAQKDPEEARNVFAQELAANPHRPDAWIGWMNSALEDGKATELLSRQAQMPTDTKQVLAHRPNSSLCKRWPNSPPAIAMPPHD